MVPSFLLMCLFFHRRPFLSCLLCELAPALCHGISSKLSLQNKTKKTPAQTKGEDGGEGSRGLSAGTKAPSADPGSLAWPQKVSHPLSKNWLGPASPTDLCFTSRLRKRFSQADQCPRDGKAKWRIRAEKLFHGSGLWWQTLIPLCCSTLCLITQQQAHCLNNVHKKVIQNSSGRTH